MRNNSTKKTFNQNECLQVQTKMTRWINETAMVNIRFALCIAVFLSITVESHGQAMTFAEDDINQTPMCSSVTGNMLTNDCDPTNDAQWLKSISFFNGVSDHPGLIGGRPFQVCAQNGIPAGTMSIYLDGSYEFYPTSTFNGKLPIKYVVEDASGATDCATLVIQVIPADNPIRNNGPIAHNDTNTTEMDMDVTGNLITNDYDLEDDDLTISEGFGDLDGDGVREELLTVGTETVVYGNDMVGNPTMAGVITLNSDGSYNFNPVAEFYGKLAIKYIVTDSNNAVTEANLTILVSPDAENQVFANDDIIIGRKNQLQSGNMLANDQGPASDFQTIIGAKNNRGISLTIDGTTVNELRSSGSLIIDLDGSFTYLPKQEFIGTESIVYTVCDDAGLETTCETATLYLTTLPSNSVGIGNSGNVSIERPEIGGPASLNNFTVGNTNGLTEEFSLYPNPGIVGDDFINLSFKSITDKAQIQIIDTNGRIVKRIIADTNASEMNSWQIDVADLIEGRYHLQLIDGANIYSETFILINKN